MSAQSCPACDGTGRHGGLAPDALGACHYCRGARVVHFALAPRPVLVDPPEILAYYAEKREREARRLDWRFEHEHYL